MSASLIVDTLARGRECYRLRWGSNSKQRIEGHVDASSTAEQIEAYRQKALAARLKKHEQLNESRQDVSRQKPPAGWPSAMKLSSAKEPPGTSLWALIL